MKTIVLLAMLIVVADMYSCKSQNNANYTTGKRQEIINRKLSADEFSKKIAALSNVQLIDVRTPGEYEGGHIGNAANINFNSGDFTERVNKLNKNEPVLVYCLSGGRSSSAADKMEEMGFSEIYNLDGGVMKWQSEGKALETGKNTTTSGGLTMSEFSKMTAINKAVLVDYNARWCEPCKKMLPMLESLSAKQKDKMALIKIDADENKELLKQKGISGIPYLELYREGKLVWHHSGYIDEDELLKEINL